MPMDLSSLLSQALTAQGYEVEDAPPLEGRSGATYPVSLIAERSGDRLLVDVLSGRQATAGDLEALDAIVEDTGLDGAIFFALGGVAGGTEASTSVDSVDLRRPEAIEQMLGSLVLDHVTAVTADPDAIGPSPIDLEAIDWQTPPEEKTAPAATDTQNGDGSSRTPQPSPAAMAASDVPNDSDVPDDGDAELLTSTPEDADPPNATAAQAETPTPAQPEPVEAQGEAPSPEEPAPEPRAAQADHAGDPTEEDDADPGGFLSPEEMAQRAQQMLENDELPSDGDAELLTGDPDPDPTPSPSPAQSTPTEDADTSNPPEQANGQGSPNTTSEPTDPEPRADPTPAPQQASEPAEPIEEGQVFEDGDCELLPSKPRQAPEEPDQAAPSQAEGPAQPQQAPPSEASAPEELQARQASSPDPSPPVTAATGSPAAAAGPSSTDAEEAFLSGGCLDPKIDEDDARREAEGALFRVSSARLELLPFHVFGYRCQLVGDGKTKEAEGRVWVSAQSGAVVEDPDGTLADDPGIPHERFQGSIPAAKANEEARRGLLSTLERRDEVREDYNETAVIERVRLSPQEESLELTRLGMAFAPRWRVEGQNGTVFVDAITGDLIAE